MVIQYFPLSVFHSPEMTTIGAFNMTDKYSLNNRNNLAFYDDYKSFMESRSL